MTETDKPSVSCVSAQHTQTHTHKQTHTHTHTHSEAERTNSIHLSSRAPCQTNARYVRGAQREPSSNQDLTTNQSWEGQEGVHLEITLATDGHRRPRARSTACWCQRLIWGVSPRLCCPRTVLLPKIYWQNVSFTGWLWKCQSCLERRDRWH